MKASTELILRHEIAGRENGPHVLVLAGVHGDEYEPMAACGELHARLAAQLQKGRVTLVPNANPSAYVSTGRYGDDGLDMARICPGKPDGSSSERAAYELSGLIRSADYLIDLHTGGVMYDISPLAGYMLHENQAVLDAQREMAFAFDLPVVWGTDPLPQGRTLSVARDAGIPAIYLEYGGGTGFRPHVAAAYVEGVLNVLRLWEMVPGAATRNNAGKQFWVEDIRPDSGFLQGKMPAPADGIFIAGTTLGTLVKKGERVGHILDPATGNSTQIQADADGLVFLLRQIVKVKKGEALGGILPISKPGSITIGFDGIGKENNGRQPAFKNH